MLKKMIVLLIATFGFALQGYTQNNSIGVHLTGIDFFGPQTGNYFFYKHKAAPKKLYWEPAFQLSYLRSSSPHLDLKTSVLLGSATTPVSANDANYLKSKLDSPLHTPKKPLSTLSAGAVFSFLPKNSYIITPEAEAGIAYYFQTGNSGVTTYAGLGFSICLSRIIRLHLNSVYQYSLSNRYQSYLQHAIGIQYSFGKENIQPQHIPEVPKAEIKKPVNPPKEKTTRDPEKKAKKIKEKRRIDIKDTLATPPTIQDTDNDGIPDEEDNCITEPGRKEMKGCPDRDRDGVADKQDACPDLKGNKTARGCPDADGDGIADEYDRCPQVFGRLKDGCPDPNEIPEQPKEESKKEEIIIEAPVQQEPVKEAVNNEVSGKNPVNVDTSNNINEASALKMATEKVNSVSRLVLFNSGTAYILPASYVALDTIANILKQDNLLHVDIEGHTDKLGNSNQNLLLSQQRADACKDYLISHGVAANRISSIGYGDMNPIADNDTPVGRNINRRTEFLLFIPEK